MGGGNGNQMPGKGTFGARVICAESRVGKFTEIGFTCTQPCGSAPSACVWSWCWEREEGAERGGAGRLPCVLGPVGFLEGYVSHLACPFFAPTTHPPCSHFTFPRPFPINPLTLPPPPSVPGAQISPLKKRLIP